MNEPTLSSTQDKFLAAGATLPGFVLTAPVVGVESAANTGTLLEFLPGSQAKPRPDTGSIDASGQFTESWTGFQAGRLIVGKFEGIRHIPINLPLGQTMRIPASDVRVLIEFDATFEKVVSGVLAGTFTGAGFADAQAKALCSSNGPLTPVYTQLLDSGPAGEPCSGMTFGFGFDANILELGTPAEIPITTCPG